jgi:hypothetical protein
MLTAEQVGALLSGELEPQRPESMDPIAWRSYLTGLQTRKLAAGDPATLTPSAVFGEVVVQVRAEFLAKFPGHEEDADVIFAPKDYPPEGVITETYEVPDGILPWG